MFGSDLLVAPVLRPEERARGVYLPAARGTTSGPAARSRQSRHHGAGHHPHDSDLRPRRRVHLPAAVVQHTGEMRGSRCASRSIPAASSAATLYEDDGATLGYTRGAFARRRFLAVAHRRRPRPRPGVTIDIAAAEGSYRPKRGRSSCR
jgi:hypothetical protein